jgi:hypothetical protein
LRKLHNERIGTPSTLELDVDAVASGAGLVECNDALFYCIDQRGLADIGPPDHGDAWSSFVLFSTSFRLCRERCEDEIDQLVNAIAMSSCNGQWITQPELMEFCCHCLAQAALGLVHHQPQGAAGLAQLRRDLAVLAR